MRSDTATENIDMLSTSCQLIQTSRDYQVIIEGHSIVFQGFNRLVSYDKESLIVTESTYLESCLIWTCSLWPPYSPPYLKYFTAPAIYPSNMFGHSDGIHLYYIEEFFELRRKHFSRDRELLIMQLALSIIKIVNWLLGLPSSMDHSMC